MTVTCPSSRWSLNIYASPLQPSKPDEAGQGQLSKARQTRRFTFTAAPSLYGATGSSKLYPGKRCNNSCLSPTLVGQNSTKKEMQSAVDHAVLLSMQRAVVLLRSSVLPQCATATSASSTLDRLLSCSSSTLGAGAPSTSTSPSWSTAASLQHLWHGRQHSTTAAGAAAAAASPSTSATAPSLPLAEASSSWQASSYEQVMREHGAMGKIGLLETAQHAVVLLATFVHCKRKQSKPCATHA